MGDIKELQNADCGLTGEYLNHAKRFLNPHSAFRILQSNGGYEKV